MDGHASTKVASAWKGRVSMARKSRKKQSFLNGSEAMLPVPNTQEDKTKCLRTAAYARLSMENSGNESDDTLKTQVAYIKDYILSQRDLILEDVYMDNGFTGTNFDRPEFERMMRDAFTGKIQCIVVKDFSRFGRDYLETGHYLETVLPKMNIRFISVSDHFDTAKQSATDSLDVPVKNIVNSFYAKDISRKMVVSNEMKRKRGETGGGFAPYGYLVDREKKAYVVDEETAPYVRVIYQWFLMGVPKNEICRRMELIGAVGLRERQQAVSQSDLCVGETGGRWRPSSVARILSNPVYAGDLVRGKTRASLYMGDKLKKMPEETWTVHEDTHEAIVLRSDYEKVQEKMRQGKQIWAESRNCSEEYRMEEKDELPQMVYCGCCGKRMQFERRTRAGEGHAYNGYTCKSREHTTPCAYHTIHENLLKMLVMDQIQLLVKSVCSRKELVKCFLPDRGQKSALLSLQKKTASLNYRIGKLKEKIEKLYQDYTSGLLEREDYRTIKETLILQRQELLEKQKDLSEKQKQLEEKAKEALEWIEHMEQYLDRRDFNSEMVRQLVNKIVVGVDDTICIEYGCRDVFKEFGELVEEVTDDGEEDCTVSETFHG